MASLSKEYREYKESGKNNLRDFYISYGFIKKESKYDKSLLLENLIRQKAEKEEIERLSKIDLY